MSNFYNYLKKENEFDVSGLTEQEISDIYNLMEVASFMESDILNEGIEDWGKNIRALAGKLGLHIGRSDGLISYITKAGKNIGQLIWYALKATTGDEQAKAKVKEIANKEIKKEDVLDFLLKLDMATLHTLTGPIHIIDAITGWHLWANVGHTSKDIIDRAKIAIENLEKITKQAKGKLKKKVSSILHKLKKLLILELLPE